MTMKLTPLETAANFSNKLQQNVENRQQLLFQEQMAQGASIRIGSKPQRSNLVKVQSTKIKPNSEQSHINRVTENPGKFLRKGEPMKMLLKYSTKRVEQQSPATMVGSQGEVVQIITKNSGFAIDLASPTPGRFSNNKAVSAAKQKETDEAERRILTQMQIYNRMQQAKLLGQPSTKFPSQMPPILKQGNSTLSSLLRYHSPKQEKPSLHNELSINNQVWDPKQQQQQLQVHLDLSTKILDDPIRPLQDSNAQSELTFATKPFLKNIAIQSQAQRSFQQQTTLKVHVTDEEEILDLRAATKASRVHGIHKNNQNLLFNTKHEPENGKMLITVPLTRTSKFGPQDQKKIEKDYRLVMLDEKELVRVMSKTTMAELNELHSIQRQKGETKQEVYFEDIYTFPIELRCKKDRVTRKRRNLEIGQRLQEEQERKKWDKIERSQRVLLQNNAYPETSQEEQVEKKNVDNNGTMGTHNFDYMNIDELKQHEQGILNLFEGDKIISRYVSHNQPLAARQKGLLQKDKKYVRLSQLEYETIFEKDPSFNEKKAFVEVFRRKWKEDKGYCSMFDKRQKFRKAKSAALGKRQTAQNAHEVFKSRQERQMLLNYQKKQARKQEETLAKQELARREWQIVKEQEERSASRLLQKALRRTRTKSLKPKILSHILLQNDFSYAQVDKYDSQMFPLVKTDSLQEIMQIMSNKAQQNLGSVISPRARSAHALGARYRNRNGPQMVPQWSRIESSQIRPRDHSSKHVLASEKPYQSDTETPIILAGKQAPLHQPLQNHDADYLSNFITQMYQTTSTQYVPQAQLEVAKATPKTSLPVIAPKDRDPETALLKKVITQSASDLMNIQGSLDSLVKDKNEDYAESMKVGKTKLDKSRENTGVHTICGTQSKGQHIQSDVQSKNPFDEVGQIQVQKEHPLNENDIKIVTVSSKERAKVQELQQQKQTGNVNQTAALQIQSQLDQNLVQFGLASDPQRTFTMPIRKQLLLGQPEDSTYQKMIYSHRQQENKQILPINIRVKALGGLERDQNLSTQSEKKVKETTASGGAIIHLIISHRAGNEGTQLNEIKVQDNLSNREVAEEKNVKDPRIMFLSGDHTIDLKLRKSHVLTDSKDSKISDDQDGSFMQPMNQRESIDSGLIDLGLIPLKTTQVKKDDSKEKLQNNQKVAGHKPKGYSTENGPTHRRKDSSSKRQPTGKSKSIEATFASNRGINSKLSNHNMYGEDEGISRQHRITINSSFGNKKQETQESLGSGLVPSKTATAVRNNLPDTPLLATNPQIGDHFNSNQDNHQLTREKTLTNDKTLAAANPEAQAQNNQDENWSQNQQKIDVFMNQMRPSVFDLPQNPMNQKSYKFNYIKARVENTRMDFIHSQNMHANQFKITQPRITSAAHTKSGFPLDDRNNYNIANQDLNASIFPDNKSQATMMMGIQSGMGTTTQSTRAMSAANRSVSNAYLRNHKLSMFRKKEQQFFYYMQQHRQNKQLLDSLEKQQELKNAAPSMNMQLIGGSFANLAVLQTKQNIGQSRAQMSRKKPLNHNRISNHDSQNLMISGIGGTRLQAKGISENKNICVRVSPRNEEEVDSKLLDTNSPNNARVIEEAYKQFNSQQPLLR